MNKSKADRGAYSLKKIGTLKLKNKPIFSKNKCF